MPLLSLVHLGTMVIVVYIVRLAIGFRRARDGVDNHPGYRTFLAASSVVGNLLPRIRGFNMGENEEIRQKHDSFASIGWDIYAAVSVWPSPRVTIKLADADMIKEVTTSRSRFPKPVEQYSLLLFFGRNIVASEGEEWKKYRKIAAPAFSDRNNRLVWDETMKTVLGLFADVWGDQEEVVLDHVVDMTMPLTLAVIGAAGFGRQMSWKDDQDEIVPIGHRMSFGGALQIVSKDVFLKIAVPHFLFPWFERLRLINVAFEELELYLVDMIRARKSGEARQEERHDLFSSLLDANDEEDMIGGAALLTESELVGNVFIFQLAGHETTAHTLGFAFGLLAMHPEEQEKLYDQVLAIVGSDGQVPGYDEMSKFTRSMAVLYETLRMFPSIPAIPKVSAEDTFLTTTNVDGARKTIPIPRGTDLIINAPGLHYNPRYWEDPYAFKPDRFLGDWSRDAFMPFSAGSRGCLGRRFIETESIAVITMMVLRYKITVKEEPQFAHETRAQRWERVFEAKTRISLTPVRVPLVFTRR